MGDYTELYLGLPMTRLPELAGQMGEPVPAAVVADIVADAPLFGPDGWNDGPDAICQALSPRIAAVVPTVPAPFDHVTDGSEHFGPIYHDEADPTMGQVFVGLRLHSNYTDIGIPEAQAASLGGGYAITTELSAAAAALRQDLTPLAPIFAEAVLVVHVIHW